ncbi:hypothetical protein [Nitrosomonas sp.]|uniref:hypothetical protein n=1 Tax=Nitrosomonas sp. TaxID=42353 RepID=UPI0025E41802|nr:hypothetical protein [Nitrosomonas sp.]MBY0483475.1 hypothetical protein [Nitrosomonas sp.]
MTKQTIELPLHKGLEVYGYYANRISDEEIQVTFRTRKIQPRRIVLEETEDTDGADTFIRIGNKWWREVKETYIPLHGGEPKLSLSGFSVQECQSILGIIETFSKTFGCWDNLVSACKKLREFIEDK